METCDLAVVLERSLPVCTAPDRSDQKTADPRLLALINKVPSELWGAKLALSVRTHPTVLFSCLDLWVWWSVLDACALWVQAHPTVLHR